MSPTPASATTAAETLQPGPSGPTMALIDAIVPMIPSPSAMMISSP